MLDLNHEVISDILSPDATAITKERAFMLRTLRAEKIVETAIALQKRIDDRFPASGISELSTDVQEVARRAAERSEVLVRPNIAIRCATVVATLAILALCVWSLSQVRVGSKLFEFSDFVQNLNAVLGSIVFIGATVVYLWSVEVRWKRRGVLSAIYELRVLAHVVDMHQPTKDPERALGGGEPTEHSPPSTMTAFELERYLNYSAELLALLSKVAAVYIQHIQDPVTSAAVDEVENLTNGLSRKIWQKIMILDRAVHPSNRPC